MIKFDIVVLLMIYYLGVNNFIFISLLLLLLQYVTKSDD